MLCIICNLQESDANAGRFHGASGISSDDYFGRSTQKSKLFAHLRNWVNPKTIVPRWFQICMPFLTVVLLNEIDNFTIHLYTLFYSVHPIHTLE